MGKIVLGLFGDNVPKTTENSVLCVQASNQVFMQPFSCCCWISTLKWIL